MKPAWPLWRIVRHAPIAAAVCLAALPAWAAQEEGQTFLGLPTLVWKVLNFLAFFGLLGYFLARPLSRLFHSRHEEIARRAAEAAREHQQTEQLRAEMEQRIVALTGEMAALKERLHREGEREREALERQGDAEAARMLAQVDREASRRVAEARRELAAEAAGVAAELAIELLQRELTPEDRERIFATTLERLNERVPGGGQ